MITLEIYARSMSDAATIGSSMAMGGVHGAKPRINKPIPMEVKNAMKAIGEEFVPSKDSKYEPEVRKLIGQLEKVADKNGLEGMTIRTKIATLTRVIKGEPLDDALNDVLETMFKYQWQEIALPKEQVEKRKQLQLLSKTLYAVGQYLTKLNGGLPASTKKIVGAEKRSLEKRLQKYAKYSLQLQARRRALPKKSFLQWIRSPFSGRSLAPQQDAYLTDLISRTSSESDSINSQIKDLEHLVPKRNNSSNNEVDSMLEFWKMGP